MGKKKNGDSQGACPCLDSSLSWHTRKCSGNKLAQHSENKAQTKTRGGFFLGHRETGNKVTKSSSRVCYGKEKTRKKQERWQLEKTKEAPKRVCLKQWWWRGEEEGPR